MAQLANPPLASAKIPCGHWVVSQLLHFSSSSLFVAWESSRGRPKALGSCTHAGHLEEVPGSWLWIGTAPAIVITWVVNHWMEDLQCLSSLYI